MSRYCLAACFLALTVSAAADEPTPAKAPPGNPPADRELHVVALYEGNTKTGERIHGGRAGVWVDRPGQTVTLVLCAHDSVSWELSVSPKTKLAKVVLGGYYRQAVEGLPKGTEVVEAFRGEGERKDYLRAPYRLDSAELRPAVRAIHKLTGQEIASYQGTYRYDPLKPLVVDRVQNDARLASDYPRVTPAAELPRVAFRAVRLTPTGPLEVAAAYGDFTQGGPDKDSLKPVPKRITRLTYDPAGKKYYGLTDHEIHEVDLAKQTSTKLDPGLAVPRVSWPCGVTFDTRRQRLVVATLGGTGYLYEYTPATGAWGVIADLNNIDLAGLAYHPADDTLYGLTPERDGDGAGVPVLYRFNAQGAVVGKSRLGPPMFPGLLGRLPVGTRAELLSAGNHLAVLVTLGTEPGERRQETESFLFLIDPKTNGVKLAWKE